MYSPTQRLMRSRTDKILSGVSGGLARYLAIDPVFVRLAFVAIALSGIGLIIYPILWLIMPLEPESAAGTPVAPHSYARSSGFQHVNYDPMYNQAPGDEEIPINNTTGSPTPDVDAQTRRNRLLGIILVSVGAMFVVHMLAPALGPLVVPALFIAAGVLLLRRK